MIQTDLKYFVHLSPKIIAVCICFVASLSFIAYIPKQSEFLSISIGFLFAFASYLYLISKFPKSLWKSLIFLAMLIRVILLFSFPNLSDDIYRFVWDGTLTNNGYNPYSYLPSELIGVTEIQMLNEMIYGKLNSPNYFTVYPPISQLIFAFTTWITDGSIFWCSFTIKCLMLLAELTSIYLIIKILDHLGFPRWNVLWYALNPMIIIEIMGNLHFEGFMICFLCGFYLMFLKAKYLRSAALLAFSIGTKLLPLMFLPFLVYRLGFWRASKYILILAMMLALIFIPIELAVAWDNFSDSLDLYFRKFEFNASLYYIAREIGYSFRGYNEIAYLGPILAISSLLPLSILWIFGLIKKHDQNLAFYFLWAFTIYLLFTTTVHPWYLAIPVAMCSITTFRFPILWSGLILLSYINYSYDPYWENLWLVAVEYGMVFSYLCYELFCKKTKIASSSN